jgi:hypothetical protein
MGRDKEIFPVVLRDISDLIHRILEDIQYKDFSDRTLRPWSNFFLSVKTQMIQQRDELNQQNTTT